MHGKIPERRKKQEELEKTENRSREWGKSRPSVGSSHSTVTQHWREVVEVDPDCLLARLNRDLIESEVSLATVQDDLGELKLAPAPGMPAFSPAPSATTPGGSAPQMARLEPRPPQTVCPHRMHGGPVRVAILSFLFNWPSTGGGNHHTAELAKFLARDDYEVKHYFAHYPIWGIGRVTDELISPSEPIEFDDPGWNVAEIQARFRRAIDTFGPDYVIITDAWKMKPFLAEAVRGHRYFMLYRAQENICPLNNLRLLATGPDHVEQRPRNQLATSDVCCRWVAERGRQSGALYRAERELAGVGTREYDQKLRASLSEAEDVLVLNPIIAAMLEPYSSRGRIVARPSRPCLPTGRMPVPQSRPSFPTGRTPPATKTTLFMAAVAGEFIKGYHVAHEACQILRKSRFDFELEVTFDPPGQIDYFTRSVGWCSLTDLPRHYLAADICLVPTIA
jgi:hypothetical protein